MFRNNLRSSLLLLQSTRSRVTIPKNAISSFAKLSSRTSILKIPSKNNYHRIQNKQFSGFGKGVDVLEEDANSLKCTIRRFGDKEFQVNNVYVASSVLLFPNSFLQWKVRSLDEFKVEDLSIFTLLYPTPQILVLGTGNTMFQDRKKLDEVINYLRKYGIAVEIMKTPDAAATFNLLNAEGRNVVAALLTLEPVTDEDVFGLQLAVKEFHEIEHPPAATTTTTKKESTGNEEVVDEHQKKTIL